jgi:hypothetical protein
MKDIIKKLNIIKSEWLLILVLSLIMIIISIVPYLYASYIAQTGFIYNGLHAMTPGDLPVYYSYIEQVKQGDYLFENLFTSETTLPLLNIFWLGVGLFAKLFNLSGFIAFQLTKILLIPFCLISSYLLISYFFESKTYRKITFVFLLFSSGTGAMASLVMPNYISNEIFYYWPMDLWVPEYNVFLTLFHSPHLIASLTLIILLFLFFLLAIETNKYKYSILAGLSGLLLIQFHPFHLPVIWIIPFLYIFFLAIFKKKIEIQHIKHFLTLIFISLPSVLYYAWLVYFDWATRLKSSQNHCYTPSLITVIASYSGLLLFSLLAVIAWIKKVFNKKMPKTNLFADLIDGKKMLFLTIWLISQFAFIFSPVIFQRRLSEGLQIPMVFLTIIGIIWLRKHLQENFKHLELDKVIFNPYLLTILFIIFFSASNWVVINEDMQLFKQNYELFYETKDQRASYLWLKNNTTKDSIIISVMPNGNFIPGIAGRKVYFGHINVETLYYDAKLARLNWFFKNNDQDEKKLEFLKQNNINYLYFSKYEKEFGKFDPTDKDYLEKVFSNDFADIYKIKLSTRL